MTTEHSYKPPFQDKEVLFVIINPGEKQTDDHPGCYPEIEFTGIEINGEPVSQEVYEIEIGKNGRDWETEITLRLENR